MVSQKRSEEEGKGIGMISRSRRLDIVFVSILSVMLIFGTGMWVGRSYTGNTNTFAPGSLETAALNVTGDWYRGTTNLTARLLGTWGALVSTSLDTGQGAYELYGMDQNVLTTSSPTFDDLTVSDQLSVDVLNFTSEFYWNDVNRTDTLAYPEQTVSYTIFKSGVNYKVKNGSTGVISTYSSFKDAIDTVVGSNTRIVLKNDNYELDIRTGFLITSIQNLTIDGSQSTISYTFVATPEERVNQMFSIDNSQNIIIENLVFNMNEDNYENGVRPAAGLSWIGRVVANSKNVGFYGCSFLNAPVSGLVIGHSNITKVIDCWFDNIGEHPVYINGGYDVTVERCVFLNYAKWIRGWIKIAGGAIGVTIKTSFFRPGEDQKGYLDSLGNGKEPAVVMADGDSGDITLEDLRCIGDVNITNRQMIRIGDATRVYVNRVYGENWHSIAFLNQDYINESQVTNSYFKNMTCAFFPMVMSKTTFLDPWTYLENSVNDSKMQNVVLVNLTSDHTPALYIGRGSAVSNIELDGCRFIGWTYRIIDATDSIDSKINNCVFSGGVSSWGLQAGGIRLKILNNLWADDNTHGTKTIYLQTGTDVIISGNTIGASLTVTIDPSCSAFISDNIGIPNYLIVAQDINATSDFWRDGANYTAWIDDTYLLDDGSETLGGSLTTDGVNVDWVDLNGVNRTTWPGNGTGIGDYDILIQVDSGLYTATHWNSTVLWSSANASLVFYNGNDFFGGDPGYIKFGTGTFDFDTTLHPSSFITLSGNGRAQTTLRPTSDAVVPLIALDEMQGIADRQEYVTLTDFTIDLRAYAGSVGIEVYNQKLLLVRDVDIRYFRLYGMYFDADNSQFNMALTIEGMFFEAGGGGATAAMYFDDGIGTSDSWFNEIWGHLPSTTYGLYVEAMSGNIFRGMHWDFATTSFCLQPNGGAEGGVVFNLFFDHPIADNPQGNAWWLDLNSGSSRDITIAYPLIINSADTFDIFEIDVSAPPSKARFQIYGGTTAGTDLHEWIMDCNDAADIEDWTISHMKIPIGDTGSYNGIPTHFITDDIAFTNSTYQLQSGGGWVDPTWVGTPYDGWTVNVYNDNLEDLREYTYMNSTWNYIDYDG